MPRHRRPVPFVIALATALLLTILWWSAVQRGIGALVSVSVQQQLDYWSTSKQDADAAAERLDGSLRTALRYTPDDPHLLEYGGMSKVWQAGLSGGDEERRLAALADALGHYRDALRRRPAWPYTWMGFAVAKAEAGQLDAEFQHAFRTALRLGPAEQVIRDGMVEMGLRVWAALDLDNRDRLLLLVRSSLATDSRELWTIVKRTGRLPLVCLLLEEDERAQQECDKPGG